MGVFAHPHIIIMLRDMEKMIYVKDCILTLQVSHFNVLVNVSNTVGWQKVWDLTLDFGPACIQSIRNLVRVLSADLLRSRSLTLPCV